MHIMTSGFRMKYIINNATQVINVLLDASRSNLNTGREGRQNFISYFAKIFYATERDSRMVSAPAS